MYNSSFKLCYTRNGSSNYCFYATLYAIFIHFSCFAILLDYYGIYFSSATFFSLFQNKRVASSNQIQVPIKYIFLKKNVRRQKVMLVFHTVSSKLVNMRRRKKKKKTVIFCKLNEL